MSRRRNSRSRGLVKSTASSSSRNRAGTMDQKVRRCLQECKQFRAQSNLPGRPRISDATFKQISDRAELILQMLLQRFSANMKCFSQNKITLEHARNIFELSRSHSEIVDRMIMEGTTRTRSRSRHGSSRTSTSHFTSQSEPSFDDPYDYDDAVMALNAKMAQFNFQGRSLTNYKTQNEAYHRMIMDQRQQRQTAPNWINESRASNVNRGSRNREPQTNPNFIENDDYYQDD